MRIPDWNFNWQSVYQYEQPVRLAAGTTLEMSITYDNAAANPRNPHRPPIATGYGQQTSDEMAEMWFQVIPVRREDRGALVESLYRLREPAIHLARPWRLDPRSPSAPMPAPTDATARLSTSGRRRSPRPAL